MRTRILQYLEGADTPLTAEKILLDALHIHSPNGLIAGRVLKSILGKDPRFRRLRNGLWTVSRLRPTIHAAGIQQRAALAVRISADRRFVQAALHLPDTGAVLELTLSDSPAERQRLLRGLAEVEERILIAWGETELRTWKSSLNRQGLQCESRTLILRKLARRLFPDLSTRAQSETVASRLGISFSDDGEPASTARFYNQCMEHLLERLPEDVGSSYETLRDWIDQAEKATDFRWFAFGPEFLRSLPEIPGVYMMRDRAGEVIYVGKTRNLRKRISSYFSPRARRHPKIARIHEHLHSLDFSPAGSEVEALLLETRLIRDFRPKINLQTRVHERPGSYGKARNIILLVPDSSERKAGVFLLRDGCFVGQHSVLLGRNPKKSLRERIKSVYFSSSRTRGAKRELWETEIVTSWLSGNRNKLNFVDVDQAGTFETVLQQLTDYLKDPERLSNKVYYR